MLYLIDTKTGQKWPINSIADLNTIRKSALAEDGLTHVTSEKNLEALDQLDKVEALQGQ